MNFPGFVQTKNCFPEYTYEYGNLTQGFSVSIIWEFGQA